MPRTFTLDTNCIIAVDESRPEAAAILELARTHQTGRASVGLVAISASERQQDGTHLENFTEFKDRIARLGLGDLELLELLEPMSYWDVTFWDFSLWCDEPMELLERSIYEILFPSIPFLWADCCVELGVDPKTTLPNKRWRNAKCDVQAFWSHLHRKRDVFVTSDGNFHAESKKARLLDISGGRIEFPDSAVALVAGDC